jgi:hypothetical protein
MIMAIPGGAVRVSTLRTGRLYKGALRDSRGRLMWACCHYHSHRDNSSYAFVRYGHLEGMSASYCAELELRRSAGPRISFTPSRRVS